MISSTGVYWVSAGIYVAAFVVLLGWLRRIPAARRRYCYPVVGVVGIATAMTLLTAIGIGTLTANGTELDLAGMVDDAIAYPMLWVLTGVLAGESRRMLGVLAVVPAIQVVAFNVASVVGGTIGLVGLLTVILGHGLIAYLLFGPIWKRAQGIPKDQRLLHWKSRNLLLFLIGMLIAYALLSVGAIFDTFVGNVIGEYIGLLIRVGFAGFLFANVDAIAVDELDETLFGGEGLTDVVTGGTDADAGEAGAD